MIRRRLAIVTSHPVQYYAPWFRYLAASGRVDINVLYLWDHGIREGYDPGFDRAVRWDVPLLEGYTHEFVPNTSDEPGTGHFYGLRNPLLPDRIKAFAPDAVLLIGYNYSSFIRLIFARWPAWPQPPLVFRGDSHRIFPRSACLRECFRRILITQIYRRFTAVLFVGKANREYLRWHGVPEKRLYFSPHAVHNERFASDSQRTHQEATLWRASLGVPGDHALVMFAGKFEDKKRPQDLLLAFARLGKTNNSLLFVGAGPLERELRLQAANIPNIYFAPFQNQSQMPRTYAAADLFVLPSYGREETWGLAINEALCLSLPVIVSNHVGCAADLVDPGRNGLVFPAGDVAALFESLQEALSDRTRLVRWGEEGRRIVDQYNYEQASEGLFNALDAICC